jgi:hypothetical protein
LKKKQANYASKEVPKDEPKDEPQDFGMESDTSTIKVYATENFTINEN